MHLVARSKSQPHHLLPLIIIGRGTGFGHTQQLHPAPQAGIGPRGPGIEVHDPNPVVRWREIYVHRVISLVELAPDFLLPEPEDGGFDLGAETEEEVVVVQIPLRGAEDDVVPDEDAEFEGRVETEGFPQYQGVFDLRFCAIVDAAVEGVVQIVRDEVAALQQEVDVVGATAFEGVGRADPGGVLGGGPVEFRDDGAAELVDG